jgi:hypothetical protein
MSRKTAILFSFAAMAAAALADGILLVLPANVSLINLGFDLMRMKPAGDVEMVCYGGTDEVASLEWFDRGSYRWLSATQSSWNAGTIPGARQDVVVIVGDSRAASDLLDAAAWADNILTPSGHNFHEIANAVHSVSPLSKKQWKALEKSYGISLREITIPSRYERGPQKRYSTPDPAPAQGLEQPPLDITPTEVIVSAPILADPAEAAAQLEAERKAAEEAAAKAAEEAAAKLEAEKKAAEEAAAKAAAEAAAKAEAEKKAAEEAAKKTVQEALEKAKSEVGAVRADADGMIAAPPVDVDPPALTISTPTMAIPEAPASNVKIPELPVVPAPISLE